ncbi:MAG TPA: chromate efflux transporter [Longimicrobium sp.]|jgi:chromate transporter|uniref:chromate efflux transporter n=1 Tax=Longimicrobium sp. TaxID=2029185 RepID=UPI002EDB7E53
MLPPIASPTETDALPHVPFREAVRTWARVGFLSFGGPAGQIAVMHRILVDEKRWIGEARFLHALNYCMLLPGPEAQQLATYVGWLLHRAKGGLVAGLLFVLPGFLTMLALSATYAAYRNTALVAALFFGLKPAIIAVVVEAVIRIGRRALKDRALVAVAAAAFAGIFFLHVPFPLIVLGAGVAGWIIERRRVVVEGPPSSVVPRQGSRGAEWMHTVRVVALWLVIWWMPVALVWMVFGRASVFVDQGLFFGHAAAVTFGGAYAVLAYVAQQAVERYGWLMPGEMLDGLGMAETTPGPLVLVLQFVAFVGAYRDPGALPPMLAGVLGATLTAWVTFAPSFLFIFAGAPYVERLRGNRALAAALRGITAAVVGVILNLAVWFALHVLFGRIGEVRGLGLRVLVPDWATLNLPSLLIAVAAAVAIFRFKAAMLPVLAGAAACGTAYGLLG